MKVLVNAISAKQGGIATYTRNLRKSLAERGVELSIAVPEEFGAGDDTALMPTRASNFGPLKRFMWEQTRWRQIVRQHKPDVLFSSANFALLNSSVPQLLLLREGGLFDPFYLANIAPAQDVPVAVERWAKRQLMLLSARQANHVMVPTEAMKSLVTAWAPELAEKCTVNPYGTLSQAFKPNAAKPRVWREDGVLRCLYVSVYYPHKNPGVLVEAVRQARTEGLAAAATITMDLTEISKVRGGACDHFLLEKAQADGLVSLGRRAYGDLPGLYGSHDVFVFPSVSETFGHPMAEAMSSGLPILAADTAVNREICGDAALYFNPFSAQELWAKLKQLDADPGLRDKLSKEGRKRALAFFKWDDHVERLIAILETIAQNGGAFDR